MEPRSCVVDPTGEQLTIYAATQVPHILRTMTDGHARRAGEQAPGHRPRRGRRLRRQDRRAARGDALRRHRAEARQAGQVDRDPVGVAAGRPPRPRPDPGHHDHGQARTARSPAWTSTCSPTWAPTSAWSARVCRSSARSCSTRSTSSRRCKFTCTNVFTTKTLTDAYRGAGRPEATFAIERIMDELAVELGRDPMELRQQNWIKHEEFPFTTVRRADLRLGQLRAGHRTRRWSCSTTPACAASRRSAALAATRSSSASASRRSPRCAAWRPSRVLGLAVLRRGRLGGREHPDAGHRQGRGRSPARPGTARATRRRSARSSPTSSACRSRTSRSCTATPRSRRRAWTPTARARWSSAASRSSRPPRRWSPRPRRSPRTCSRRPRTTSSSRTASSRSRAPTRARPSRRSRSPRSWRTTTRRTWSPRLDSDAVYDPENFSFPHGTHLAAIEVDTETGRVDLRKYVCVDDIGNVVNPLIVEGQVHGGLAQGIAQALFEEANYDEQGTLVNGTFVDYTLPSAADLPSFDTATVSHPGHVEPAGGQGRRRGGHHRLDAGHRQRRDRRAAPPRRHQRRDAHAPRSGCGGPSRTPRAAPPRRPRSTPTRPGAGLGSIDPNNPQGEVQ